VAGHTSVPCATSTIWGCVMHQTEWGDTGNRGRSGGGQAERAMECSNIPAMFIHLQGALYDTITSFSPRRNIR